ncbi:MAG TPA: hypothetical protein VNL16_10305 [Chloroflexota bacterium]|nr:hypothetical protein [Chloroflexota bacterium]
MQLVGDVKCYYCGFVSGEMVSGDGQSLKNGTFRPALGVSTAASRGALRCIRCGGPVFIDDVRTERPRPLPISIERERPGRPRRSRPRAAESAGVGSE